MYQYITALRSNDIMLFKEQFRSVDVLMGDDVQFISGKDSTQEEFFHTFNALIDQNKQLVISADRSPSDLDGVEERIKSRLGLFACWFAEPISSALKVEAICSSETSVETQRTTRRHIPEDDTLHNHRCENLKSYIP
jgi:chromosomal replication initiation ATPase DnaA